MESLLVVYIIGDNRSGSTLLDYLLSCHPEAVSVGELHHLKDFYLKQGVGINYDWRCSCGSFVQDCNFWKDILDVSSFTGTTETNLEIKQKNKFSFLKRSKFLRNLEWELKDKEIDKRGEIMALNRWDLYRAIAQKSHKNIIIDSSKNASEAFFLNKYKNGNIKFLNIEREIQAVALSKKNRLEELSVQEKRYLNVKNRSLFIHILVSYKILLQNQIISLFLNREGKKELVKTISYSNLTLNTKQVMNELCRFLEIPVFEVPLNTNQNKASQHILCGSPSRYMEKPIRYDARWKIYYKRRPFAFIISKCFQKLYNSYPS